MKKKVMFVHYRTGERDGVSLEIEKRVELLEKLGHEVYYLSGHDPRAIKGRTSAGKKSIYIIPEFDIKKRLPIFLRETYFDERILEKHLAWLLYQSEEEKIYAQITKVLKSVKPDYIFIHNMFSIAFHMPASTALLKALDYHPTKVIAVHHDFWWERGFLKTPRYEFLKDILHHFPPNRDYIIKHHVINSLAEDDLFNKRGIVADMFGDSYDFSFPLPKVDAFNNDFLYRFGINKHDIVILHATRIVPRKAIENAIYFVAFLQKLLRKSPQFIFRGREINNTSKVVLVLPNFSDVDTLNYIDQLQILAEQLSVKMLIITQDVGLNRYNVNGFKKYSFWDCYTFSDFITYTSFWEGYGNQLLEAFWAKRIPLLFEYPVYKKDIKDEGYSVISLGDKMRLHNGLNLVPLERIEQAAEEALDLLRNQREYDILVKQNFAIAKQKHDVKILEQDLISLIK